MALMKAPKLDSCLASSSLWASIILTTAEPEIAPAAPVSHPLFPAAEPGVSTLNLTTVLKMSYSCHCSKV
jgi:hypothetical protein